MPLNKKFGDALRELREEKGYSRFKLAQLARISASEEAELEEGKRYPRAVTIGKLSEALGVSRSTLIELLESE